MTSLSISGLGKAWRQGRFALGRRLRRPVAGRFQPYAYTEPDRYPWLFDFARSALQDLPAPRLLSFGCSRGDEAFSLRRYLPSAEIKGVDIDPANIALCIARSQREDGGLIDFEVAASMAAERSAHYDAIFCLAVLCHGDLTVTGARRCDPLMRFEDFERTVAGFARCLKPGGLLFLHTTSFRFSDTAVAAGFEPVLEAQPEEMAPDPLFDASNRLIRGQRYYPVGFRKRA